MAFFTRFIVALFGMAFAILLTLGVLCWLALYAVFACLRWLATGQKPQVLLMWQQIQAMRRGMQSGQGGSWSSWSRTSDGQWHEAHGQTSARDSKGEVIEDAVVRDISDQRSLPKN